MSQINRRILKWALGVLLLSAVTAARAQPGTVNQRASGVENEEPRFQIELIVFRYEAGNPSEEDLDHNSIAADVPRRLQLPGVDLATVFEDPEDASDAAPDFPDTGPEDALALFDPDSYSAAGGPDAVAIPELPPSFRRLREDELTLNAVRARLDRISAYTVLAHTGWVQAGVDGQAAPWVDLRYLGLTNPTGSVRVRRGRFFFVTLDLLVHDERDVYWDPAANTELMPLLRGPTYPFEEERSAIREGRLVFFDHPLFGVLVQITPVVDEGDPERPAA